MLVYLYHIYLRHGNEKRMELGLVWLRCFFWKTNYLGADYFQIFPPSSLVSLDLLLDSLHCLHLKCCLGRGAADREVTVPKGRVRGGLVQTTRLYLPHSLT